MGLSNILESLYEYEVMTPKQLALLNGYRLKTVYEYLYKLSNYKEKHSEEVQPKVRKIDLTTKRGAKGYYLSPKAARQIAESRNELHYFKEKDWETAPGNIYNILMANQFICEVIQASKQHSLGISEWVGRKTLMKRYIEDEKGVPQFFNALIEVVNDTAKGNEKRIVYLNVVNSSTDKSVIREMMNAHYDIIRMSYEEHSNKILLLFIYTGRKLNKELLSSWKRFFLDKKDAPVFGVASFEQLGTKGVMGNVWQTHFASGTISLTDMPFIQLAQERVPLLGIKKNDDEMKFIQGFL